jgi:hypothetical protein
VRQVVELSIDTLMKAETYWDIHYVITNAGISLGYDYFGYQYWPGAEEYGDRNFAGVVQCNYPEAWMTRYVEQGFYDIDPVRLYGLSHEGVIEWRQLSLLDPAQQQFMREAADHTLEHGVVGSFHDSEGGRLQVAFAGPAHQGEPALALEVLPVLGPLMTVSFRKASQLESRIRWLTERQRDAFFALRRKTLARYADYL